MKYLFLLTSFLLTGTLAAQYQVNHVEIAAKYDKVKEESLTNRRFKHADVVSLIQKLPRSFSHKQVGSSVLGKSIHLVEWGNGPVSIYLWSQMHGDEATATQALFDIFNALNHPDYKWVADALRDKVKIYAIPMLNPDGADVFTRRNAMGIDLNRDALNLASPEARILKGVRDSIDADWGFNLHDQNRYYSAGLNNPYTAIISFLAPAYNYEKDINNVRGDAMRLIGLMNDVLQHYAPNGIGKYSDAFEPRAFGDNIQKWGTRTILIESGAKIGDREKQSIREYNFTSLMTAFLAIADESYKMVQIEEYDQIPFNESNGFHELILRGGSVMYGGKWYHQDVAFRFNEVDNEKHTDFSLSAYIKDVGDMSIYAAYDEKDVTGYKIHPGKVYDTVIKTEEALQKLDAAKLLEQGITDVKVEGLDIVKSQASQPMLTIYETGEKRSNAVRLGNNPSLILKKAGAPTFLVKNGTIYDVNK